MGILLVYDVTNPKSFDNIAKWLRNIDEVCVFVIVAVPDCVICQINNLTNRSSPISLVLAFDVTQHANEDVEKMILGNKCDMEEKRVITKERGESIAREHAIRFLETSAKANINIDDVFLQLAEAILDKVRHLF